MSREGLFLEVPALPEGEAGLQQAERLAGVPQRRHLWMEEGAAVKTAADVLAAGRRMVWEYLQAELRTAIAAWFATLDPDMRARMDPRLLDQFPSEDAAPVARNALMASLYKLLNGPAMRGAFWVDDKFQVIVMPQSLDHVVIGQLVEAIRDRRAYRLCDHCGRPFAYKSERATYCGPSCKTLAWKKRRDGK